MNRTKMLQEIRLIRFDDVFYRWIENRLTQQETALMLGVCERTFRRYCRCYEAYGADGLYDARLDKVAHNAAPTDKLLEVLTFFETHYSTFTAAHFFDKHHEQHHGQRSYDAPPRWFNSSIGRWSIFGFDCHHGRCL